MTTKKTVLTCEQCKGAMSLPENDSVSMVCPYCGHEHIIPPHIQQKRAAQFKAARKREEKAQAKQRAAEEKKRDQKTARFGLIVKGSIVLIVSGCVVGLVLYIMDAAKDKRPTDSKSTGMTAANQWLAQKKAAGCSYVVTAPTLHSGRYGWEANLQKGGDCIQVLAAVDDGETNLQMSLTAPDMARVPAQRRAALHEITHCGQQDGKYPVQVLSNTANWYTFAAIACPRTMFETPPPTDPVSTGAEEVARRMKDLHQKGCKSIVHHAKQAKGDISWIPEFPKSKRGNCLVVLAATGIPGNTLTLSVKNPFGEALPVPQPGLAIAQMVCGTTSGPHPVAVFAATDGPYTFAAVGCPRPVAKKLNLQ